MSDGVFKLKAELKKTHSKNYKNPIWGNIWKFVWLTYCMQELESASYVWDIYVPKRL